jgi:hypothetical protein
MISSYDISQAVNLCTLNNVRFSDIGERCFSQLETSGLLGEMNSSDEADDLFLSLVISELQDDADDSFEHSQQVWALAA